MYNDSPGVDCSTPLRYAIYLLQPVIRKLTRKKRLASTEDDRGEVSLHHEQTRKK